VDEPTDSQAEQAELGHNDIHAIYASGNETVINRVNKLLINALCQADDDSRFALSQFFDVPTTRRAAGPEVDRVLISQVRLLINGANANQLQTWLSSYETSAAYSSERSALEKLLRSFVVSRSQIEAMKSNIVESRALRTELSSNREELKLLREDMRNQVRKLRERLASKERLP
jgi:hypothetical protein